MCANLKNRYEFLAILDNKMLFSDGAMGTELQKLGFKGSPDLLNLDAEALKSISKIHLDYILAGSDIIQTNTIGSSFIKLKHAGYEQEIKRINSNAVDAARNARNIFYEKHDKSREIYIAGDIGPSGELLEPYGNTSFDFVVESFAKQAEILLDCGVDIIVIETMIDLNEAKAAVKAVRELDANIAVACTLSFRENGVTVMGNRAEEFGEVLVEAGSDIIGANCSVGSDSMVSITGKIRNANPSAKLFIQPNAGLPKLIDGKTVFLESPETMAENFRGILKFKPDIIGACCGSTPEHIKKIAELVNLK
ncbi:MAG: 5-methyltetrahydrofolate--homocysteine methyltransferase [Actinobacteria bacterium]|nr:5-methyltetrahydrofolate--homocysteine methyltransferase [Actinomycetota bacterium]